MKDSGRGKQSEKSSFGFINLGIWRAIIPMRERGIIVSREIPICLWRLGRTIFLGSTYPGIKELDIEISINSIGGGGYLCLLSSVKETSNRSSKHNNVCRNVQYLFLPLPHPRGLEPAHALRRLISLYRNRFRFLVVNEPALLLDHPVSHSIEFRSNLLSVKLLVELVWLRW